jgi:hypothetical protein
MLTFLQEIENIQPSKMKGMMYVGSYQNHKVCFQADLNIL